MWVLAWLWAVVRSVLNGIARIVVFVLLVAIVLLVIGIFRGDGIGGTPSWNSIFGMRSRTKLHRGCSPWGAKNFRSWTS